MLRRHSYIGREGRVLKDLMKMPGNLQELYSLLLDECYRERSFQQFDALKKFFAFLAFSKRSLTLGEASSFVEYVSSETTVDIEEEVIGRSARYVFGARIPTLPYDLKRDSVEILFRWSLVLYSVALLVYFML